MDRCRSLYPILLQIKSCCPCTVPGPQCPVWSDRAAAGRGRGHCSNCSNCSTGHGLQLLIVTRTSCGEAGPRGYDGQEAGIRDAHGISREQLRKATSGPPRPVPASPRCPVPGTAGIEHFLLHLCSLAGCRGRGCCRLQAACVRGCTATAAQLQPLHSAGRPVDSRAAHCSAYIHCSTAAHTQHHRRGCGQAKIRIFL